MGLTRGAMELLAIASPKRNRNGALVRHSPFLFRLAPRALDRVRQWLVVGVAPLVNELSLLLRGFLFASLLLGCLLLSCHIVLLLSLVRTTR